VGVAKTVEVAVARKRRAEVRENFIFAVWWVGLGKAVEDCSMLKCGVWSEDEELGDADDDEKNMVSSGNLLHFISQNSSQLVNLS
jgi:hypothetical protein